MALRAVCWPCVLRKNCIRRHRKLKNCIILDLNIDISENRCEYTTHRKELATYNYTPFDSNTSAVTLLGIIATEALRLLRTNSTERAFNYQVDFFVGKLQLNLFKVHATWCVFFPVRVRFFIVYLAFFLMLKTIISLGIIKIQRKMSWAKYVFNLAVPFL